MHSIYARFNGLSALWSTCIVALLAAIALSSFVFTANTDGKIDVVSLKVFNTKAKRYPYKESELAFVKFNITADLRPLFHWNTKQLFVYLEAEYTNAQGVNNSVVLWDRIVRRKEDAYISQSSRNKYKFRELSESFKNVSPAEFSLKYNVMPYVGVLTYGEAGRTTGFDMPEALDAVS
ncbi:signal peptidase 22 kDa subunit [Melanogaster broomeanus]|nr:signal peptidase 22 kDa subunit [Melanogaster broomeanus]